MRRTDLRFPERCLSIADRIGGLSAASNLWTAVFL